jgi:hypothetical protein
VRISPSLAGAAEVIGERDFTTFQSRIRGIMSNSLVFKITDESGFFSGASLVLFVDGGRYPAEPDVITLAEEDGRSEVPGLYLYPLPDDLPVLSVVGLQIVFDLPEAKRRSAGKLLFISHLELVDDASHVVLGFDRGAWASIDENGQAIASLANPRHRFIGLPQSRSREARIDPRPDVITAPLGYPSSPPSWNPLSNAYGFAAYNRLLMSATWVNNRWTYDDIYHNLDEEDYGSPTLLVRGGTELFNEFQFLMTWPAHLYAATDFAIFCTYDLIVPRGCTVFNWLGTGSTAVRQGPPAFRYMRIIVANLTQQSIMWDKDFRSSSASEQSIPPDWFQRENFPVNSRDELRISFIFWMGRRSDDEWKIYTGVQMRTCYFATGGCP